MTLLTNRPEAATYEEPAARQDGRKTTGRNNSTMPATHEEALRTLKDRLQSKLGNSTGYTDGDSGPEERFLLQSARRRLDQVNVALERIEEGKYGICADCAEPIENYRLVLQPMSIRCTRCQTVADWRGVSY